VPPAVLAYTSGRHALIVGEGDRRSRLAGPLAQRLQLGSLHWVSREQTKHLEPGAPTARPVDLVLLITGPRLVGLEPFIQACHRAGVAVLFVATRCSLQKIVAAVERSLAVDRPRTSGEGARPAS
jgi:hypothetical protein